MRFFLHYFTIISGVGFFISVPTTRGLAELYGLSTSVYRDLVTELMKLSFGTVEKNMVNEAFSFSTSCTHSPMHSRKITITNIQTDTLVNNSTRCLRTHFRTEESICIQRNTFQILYFISVQDTAILSA